MNNTSEPFVLPVKALLQYYNPFGNCPWGYKKPISKLEVEEALFVVDLLSPTSKIKSRRDHIRLIAWLAANGWGEPIMIWPSCTTQPIIEGHHRLRAALIRGDENIKVISPKFSLSQFMESMHETSNQA